MFLSALWVAAWIAGAGLSMAQDSESAKATETSSGSQQVYPRSFFDRYFPQTALDIIARVPGFSLDAGDDLRGFGGAAGNVLIDGERPSSKTGGVVDALRRIPANQVDRVILIRGSAGLSEAAGQAVVANLLRSQGGTAGSWEAEIERAADGIVYPSAEVTLARAAGPWRTSTKLNGFWERFPLAGPRVRRDAGGMLLSSQSEDRPSVLTEIFASSEAERPLADGTLTLTGRFGRSAFLPETDRLGFDGRSPDDSPDERLFIDFDSVFLEGEVGVDWARPLASGWSLKLLSLSSFQDLDQEQKISDERPVGNEISGSTFLRLQDSFETVLRASLTRAGDAAVRAEVGGEVTYNSLDSRLSLEVRDENGVEIIDLPTADVLVEELRGEAYTNLIWPASENWSVETGLAAEVSEISVSGDADNRQSFLFLKPFATFILNARPGTQFRFGVRHRVGQLSFSDFAASASAEDDRVLAGNPELAPEQTTRASFVADFRREGRLALNVELFHEWRSDLIEQIELSPGSFGAANAGDGRGWGGKVDTSIFLAPWIPGGLIEVEAEVRDASFLDPLTGRRRQISGTTSPTVLAEFRQDLPQRGFAWGLSYRAAAESEFYFADEESLSRSGESWGGFVETNRLRGVRLRLSLADVGGRDFSRVRRFFEPSRSGDFAGSEAIDRSRGEFITLTLTRQF
ncbi:hypothetical protein ABI59_17740 [Acidobacteria bacterium Mor1]|nr:hypothetical protein ABI59_17740 [Acidobacteria bacterium Mor1]